MATVFQPDSSQIVRAIYRKIETLAHPTQPMIAAGEPSACNALCAAHKSALSKPALRGLTSSWSLVRHLGRLLASHPSFPNPRLLPVGGGLLLLIAAVGYQCGIQTIDIYVIYRGILSFTYTYTNAFVSAWGAFAGTARKHAPLALGRPSWSA